MKSVPQQDFATVAERFIAKLQDAIESKVDVQDSCNAYGVYTFKTNAGEFVVNRQ